MTDINPYKVTSEKAPEPRSMTLTDQVLTALMALVFVAAIVALSSLLGYST